MVHFTNSPVQSPVLVQPGLSHLRQVSAKRKQEVNLQSKSCDSDVCGQSEASLWQGICVCIYCRFLYISVHHQGAAAPQLHCTFNIHISANQLKGKHALLSSDWLVFSDSLNDCWCLFLSLLDHFCFLNVMMSWWCHSRGRGGRGVGVIHVFAFLISSSLRPSSFLRSSLWRACTEFRDSPGWSGRGGATGGGGAMWGMGLRGGRGLVGVSGLKCLFLSDQ